MASRLVKVIFKIAFSVLFLLFINNPIEPLSIPFITNGIVRFHPLFQAESVLQYQIIFSLFALAELMAGIFEFIIYPWRKIFEIIEELIGIAQLWFLREIPKEVLAIPENILNRLYPGLYWFFSIIMLLAAIGVIVKVFHLFSDANKPINPK